MTGYHGFVQSVIRRGIDAYQVTLGIYPDALQEQDSASTEETANNLLVYRADIAIEDDRTILFPDRELSRCMDAYYNVPSTSGGQEVLETERTVGSIAARICGELSGLLLERAKVTSALVGETGKACGTQLTGE